MISNEQFQEALSRFGLGDFVEATPISGGLFGQNVFVVSTRGQYVLRGAPHYEWQFPKEKFMCDLLHEKTQAPVAWPYLLDPNTDIFGWSYLLMPRLRGESVRKEGRNAADRLGIARAMGENLARMHGLTWPFAGEYELTTNTIQPFAHGWTAWVISDLRLWLEKAHNHSRQTNEADALWVESVIRQAQDALTEPFEACFVMNDYNPGNVVIERQGSNWCVSGLFDLMEGYFGDGEADLMRPFADCLDEGKQQDTTLARAFARSYWHHETPRPGFAARYALYMLRDRLIIWEYGTRPGNNWFSHDWSLRRYAEPYIRSYERLDLTG